MAKIIAPFGEPVEARPPVPSLEERLQERERRRAEKEGRRAARRAQEEAAALNGEEGDAAVREAREAEVA